MDIKKFISLSLLFFLFTSQVFSLSVCVCRKANGASLTTYGFAVGDFEDCCTGSVDAFWGGNQRDYEMGLEGVYELVSTTAITGLAAQSACCQPG